YGPLPEVLEHWLVFRDSANKETRLAGLGGIETICGNDDLTREVSVSPKQWADLIAFYHDLGIVLYQSVRFGSLVSFGLDLQAIEPRVLRGKLVFLVMKVGLDLESRPINLVQWELETKQLDVQAILNVEDLEAGRKKWEFELDNSTVRLCR